MSLVLSGLRDCVTSARSCRPTSFLILFMLCTAFSAINAQTSSSPIPAGVDYGLKRQCIRTPSPGAANFFYDDVDCPGSSYPTSRYWTTAVETESTLATQCTGALDQSFPINTPN